MVINEKRQRTGAPVHAASGLPHGTVRDRRGTTAVVESQPAPGAPFPPLNGEAGYSRRSATVAREGRVNIEESYQRARPGFEADFASRADPATGNGGAVRTFAQAEPNYRAGFMAGHDLQYEGRTFAEVEPDLRREYETSVTGTGEHTADAGAWERMREEIRAGFHAARDSRR